MWQIIRYFLVSLICSATLALPFAFLIQFASKVIVKFKPTYKISYIASFIHGVATTLIFNFILTMAVIITNGGTLVAYIITYIIGFFLVSWLTGNILKHPESGAIGLKKAVFVNFIYSIIVMFITLVPLLLFLSPLFVK